MTVNFYKYHGTGNDFIIIDNREKTFKIDNKIIEKMCSRRFGIGADGLMLLENDSDTDFRMVYFNSDGYEGTMCGNGGRCIVAFANKLGVIKNKTKFIAVDGIHFAEVNNGLVSLKMLDLDEVKNVKNDYFLNTGSPHYVKFVDNYENVNVYSEGKAIRNSSAFKAEGTNVNFAQLSGNKIKVGTYERGVEDETYSCGTGVTAVAICAYLESDKKINNFDIETKGGNLNVRFEKNNSFENIWLTGTATFVYKGEYQINE
jgi:diaminopimelate epimerase